MFRSLPLPEWNTLREAADSRLMSWMLHGGCDEGRRGQAGGVKELLE